MTCTLRNSCACSRFAEASSVPRSHSTLYHNTPPKIVNYGMGSHDLSFFWFPQLGRNDSQLILFMYTTLVSRGCNLFPQFSKPWTYVSPDKNIQNRPLSFGSDRLVLERLTRGYALFWLWQIICPTGGPQQVHFFSTCLALPSRKQDLPLKLSSFSLCQLLSMSGFQPSQYAGMRDIAIKLELPQLLLLWASPLG